MVSVSAGTSMLRVVALWQDELLCEVSAASDFCAKIMTELNFFDSLDVMESFFKPKTKEFIADPSGIVHPFTEVK